MTSANTRPTRANQPACFRCRIIGCNMVNVVQMNKSGYFTAVSMRSIFEHYADEKYGFTACKIAGMPLETAHASIQCNKYSLTASLK